MGRIMDTTNNPTPYEMLTQTPKNFSMKNYFLNELQEKVWADWEYRPNRVDVEQEKTVGKDDYFPLEVVIQNVRNDKGEKVSDDYKRLVFRDIDYKVRLGSKFRFSFDFDLEQPNSEKNIWLVTNKNSTIPTSGVVVTRCNGTLGSVHTKESGENFYHYEPCICTTELSSANFHYTNTIVTTDSQIILVVQHNEFTKEYYENQRFIVGYDKVYKVKAINKFNSLKTYDPEDVDVLVIYAEKDEISSKDNFETRIALNKDEDMRVEPPVLSQGDYVFSVSSPVPLPTELYSVPIRFIVGLYLNDSLVNIPVEIQTQLENCSNPDNYFELIVEGGNTFILRRKKVYNRSKLQVVCFISAENSPTGERFEQTFELSLRGLE